MRDSLRLRQRLVLAVSLPALMALACDGDGAPKKEGEVAKNEKGEKGERKAKRGGDPKLPKGVRPGKRAVDDDGDAPEGDEDAKASTAKDSPLTPATKPSHVSTQSPQGELASSDPRLAPVPGDPPFIDGYNPEEETCPSGNWCGTIETATVVSPKGDAMPKQMDCPARIVGAHDPTPIKGKSYEGLSDKKQMQGALNQHGTELARAAGKKDACCYHWFEYCSGRPLLDGNESVVAQPRSGSSWIDPDVEPELEALSDEAKTALARAWLDDALREHASIASFSRATLELLALAAPPELIEGCQQAVLDEVDHARRCFALASAYAGKPIAPGPLPALAPRDHDHAGLALETFVEGCVGETVAALVAERAMGVAKDETVRATLRVIVEDESRHAALAWRTIAWAIAQGGSPVINALSQMLDTPPSVEPGELPPRPAVLRAALAAHGRLDEVALAQTVRDAWQDIIAPMLRSLLGRRPLEVAAERA
ncbi:MAG TPA: ferritin-like domain-containing protein [Nannocystaceae bacterium]|nr:ferritin-like domain-containing protein [Nannocystaceae bacterium]